MANGIANAEGGRITAKRLYHYAPESSYGRHREMEEAILQFWFGDYRDPGEIPATCLKWFAKDDAFDAEIRSRFEGALKSPRPLPPGPRGQLAYILLYDQFPRNLYRGTPKAFSFDSIALPLALKMIEAGDDLNLLPLQAFFVYLPFQHAEDLEMQRLSMKKVEDLKARSPASLARFWENALPFVHRHFEIIERFGRFPHRNSILNRSSSVEEMAFLKEPMSSF